MTRLGYCLTLFALATPAARAQIDEIEREPINYKTATAENPIVELQQRIDAGKVTLPFTDDHGYLAAVLKELDVPLSSQVLVFSKTSLQRQRITPKTPRAIYFNDDVYVGFCLRGDVLELSAADTAIGTAFYTLQQNPNGRARFARQSETCLACHGTAATDNVPGHLVRSVFTDRTGQPVLSAGTFRTTHASPMAERWGGWYVTGTHGPQAHLGNWVVENTRDPAAEGNAGGQNVTRLADRFTIANYPTPHSDLVALMVLEHQIEAHNRLARAMVASRQARHYEAELNKALGEPAGRKWDSATTRVTNAGERLAEYLLFAEEAKLTAPIAGTSDFAREFAARGPFDKAGRSLRDFDLQTRLFKYPCSYLVYSRSFTNLPADVKAVTLRKMHAVLTGRDQSPAFAHLTPADRTAIREILRDTLPDLPDDWRK